MNHRNSGFKNDNDQLTWSAYTCSSRESVQMQLSGLEAAHPPVARRQGTRVCQPCWATKMLVSRPCTCREIICDFHLFNLSHAKMLCLTQRLDLHMPWLGHVGISCPCSLDVSCPFGESDLQARGRVPRHHGRHSGANEALLWHNFSFFDLLSILTSS